MIQSDYIISAIKDYLLLELRHSYRKEKTKKCFDTKDFDNPVKCVLELGISIYFSKHLRKKREIKLNFGHKSKKAITIHHKCKEDKKFHFFLLHPKCASFFLRIIQHFFLKGKIIVLSKSKWHEGWKRLETTFCGFIKI